jgi:N-acetylmuramoyl-L-alanine amidase
MTTTGFGRRSFIAGLGGLALIGNGAAQAAGVTGIDIAESGAGVRVTLRLDGRVAWRLTARDKPPRLLLALPGADWKPAARLQGDGLVKRARWLPGQKLLVFDLARPVAAPVVAGGPGGITLDLLPGDAAGFARLAGRSLASAGAPSAPVVRRQALPLIVLDPGHGGRDPGTIGVAHGTLEKRITLPAALELKRQLEAGERCRVVLTRSRDIFIPLEDRVTFARKREAALFVSLHADSAPGARGASVYTLNERASDALSARLAREQNAADRAGGLNLPPVSPEVQRILISLVRQETITGSARLARMTVAALDGTVPLLPNTHREAAFVVLKAPDIPSMLVEMGFLSNATDEAALRRPDHRARVCGALTRAIHGWVDRR